MNYIDKDIKDFYDYIEFTTFNKFNIRILFTKKHYGSVPEKSREEVAKDFSLKNKVMVSSHQTHSDNVVLVGENTDITYFEDTDGILTSNKDVAILTKYADCLPIFIYASPFLHSPYFRLQHISDQRCKIIKRFYFYKTSAKDFLNIRYIGIITGKGAEYIDIFQFSSMNKLGHILYCNIPTVVDRRAHV